MRFHLVVMSLLPMLFAAMPAQAQFFLKPADLRGAPVNGTEPGIIPQALPDATPAEYRAALVWNVRAALNVAALQCQFERTLLTDENYNAMLRNHREELAQTYDTLTAYFLRSAGSKKAGQTALDQFNTRVYSGFSTVSAQLIFCHTAGSIGRQALFAPRGQLHVVAEQRMRELRSSLIPWGEQQFPGGVPVYDYNVPAAFGNPRCWRRDEWQPKRCGPPFRGELPRG